MLPVVVLLVLLSACAQGHTDGPDGPDLADPRSSAGGWREIADSPLSGRDDPAIAYVAGEVVVVGGYTGPACPPSADCAFSQDPERDGAAYSPTTGTWRSIANAPVPLLGEQAPAVVGDRLYLLAGRDLLRWDSSDDAWTREALPGRAASRRAVPAVLSADGTRLIVASGSDEHGVHPDLILDTRTGDWSQLPPDPLSPAFDRTITATSAGLVLTARGIDAHGNPDDPALLRAAVLAPGTDAWRVLPESEQLGGGAWTWTGTRMVDATLGGADGGEVDNYGRTLPYGGRLDPRTGEWTALPDAPGEDAAGWPVFAPGGPQIASAGWLYDDDTPAWTRLLPPRGAPATPGPAVWAGPDLFVYGGGTWHGDTYERSSSAWMLRAD